MSTIVPAADIERIVGAPRDPRLHLGRAVTAEQQVYVLHSQECKDSGIDLRECQFSKALDQGVDRGRWEHRENVAVVLVLRDGRLDPWDYKAPEDGACYECPVEDFEWSDTLWVAGAPVMVCDTHGNRAPGYVYEVAL